MTDQEHPNNEEDELVEIVELEFDLEEVNVGDNAIMLGKQYIIMNSKLNTILQFLNDNVGKSYMSGEEVDFSLKSQESSTKTSINNGVTSLE